jgi:isoleucyl-tRNA synthetase
VLRERGVLLHDEKFSHSYPHCWRHKTPVAFRATTQWFFSMEQAQLRAQSLAAIKQVKWLPGWGEERIAGMVGNRPDWCISRQRTWGVPIAIFAHRESGVPHPRTVELLDTVATLVERDGIDAWFDLDPRTLIGADAEHYEKVTDVLDVWYDSGVTHSCVLDARAELSRAQGDVRGVMYLEGSDQHRGWFQSSLLTSVAMHGRAPYDEVITYGFTVDPQGRKMSKSLGNVVAPETVMKTLGADILRLWVASTDYSSEMSVGDEILKRAADSYRRLRNTARFLLGNLAGFDPALHAVPLERLLPLDRWALAKAVRLMQLARRVYGPEANADDIAFGAETYSFQLLAQEMMRFATVDMGAGYLDMTKDRLYTLPLEHPARRSAQTAMYWTLEILVRALAPIMAFTAEELWTYLPARNGDSVLRATWDDLAMLRGFALEAHDQALFDDLEALRSAVLKQTETLRNGGQLGGSLEAEVALVVDPAIRERFAACAAELRFFFITSEVLLLDPADAAGFEAEAGATEVAVLDGTVRVLVRATGAGKCVRCWHHRPDVGAHAAHPELCGRCVENIDGAGETRRWF